MTSCATTYLPPCKTLTQEKKNQMMMICSIYLVTYIWDTDGKSPLLLPTGQSRRRVDIGVLFVPHESNRFVFCSY